MTDKLIILTTVDKEELADKIAGALVERRLAACVNLFPLGVSIYRWKEKVCRDREYVPSTTTSPLLLNEVRDPTREFHTYEPPEVIALPVAVGEEKVLEWMPAAVKPRSGPS